MKLTKGKVLASSFLALSVSYLITEYFHDYCLIYKGMTGVICSYFVGIVTFIFFISVPVLFFSFVTYFFREGVFRSWLRFTKWMIFISAVLMIIVPNNDAGGNSLRTMSSGGFVVLLLSVFYFLISFFIIIYKSIKLKGK
ncbi:MAG: hypothetical protein NT098_04650 [Candidatus Parcubacteria bacterium]|nr:hypothetical protein [Candidatus Parcubacteria bacterium]